MIQAEALSWLRENGVGARRENGRIVLASPANTSIPFGLIPALKNAPDDLLARTQTTKSTTNGATSAPSPWTPKITRLSDVKPEFVRHIWRGRIPLAKVSVVDGDPGLGKTTALLDVSARITRGMPMPDGTESDLDGPAGVVILTAEDGLADTIRPRLDAAGADVTRVAALECLVNGEEERSVTLDNLDAIEAAVLSVDAKMVIIDPLMAYLSSDTNSYRDQDMRRVLAPLARLAERLDVAIVVIRHLSKGGGANAVYRGGGSIGIIGAARCGLLVATDPDDASGERRILAVTKSNLSAMPPALAYTLQPAANGTAYINWEGATDHTARQLLAIQEDDEERGASDDAKAFLISELTNGPRDAAEILRAAKAVGIAERTLKRAKKAANVTSEKTGMTGGWVWRLDDKRAKSAEECQEIPKDATEKGWPPSKNVGTLRDESPSRPITERDLSQLFPDYGKAATDDD